MFAPVMVAAAIMLSACGGGAKDFIADNYSKTSQDGDVVLYSSKDPVGTTVSRIVDADEPAARSADGGNEYSALRRRHRHCQFGFGRWQHHQGRGHRRHVSQRRIRVPGTGLQPGIPGGWKQWQRRLG